MMGVEDDYGGAVEGIGDDWDEKDDAFIFFNLAQVILFTGFALRW